MCKTSLLNKKKIQKSHFSVYDFDGRLFDCCSRVVRKSIARVLTVINQTQKENLRKFYKVSNVYLWNYDACQPTETGSTKCFCSWFNKQHIIVALSHKILLKCRSHA